MAQVGAQVRELQHPRSMDDECCIPAVFPSAPQFGVQGRIGRVCKGLCCLYWNAFGLNRKGSSYALSLRAALSHSLGPKQKSDFE